VYSLEEGGGAAAADRLGLQQAAALHNGARLLLLTRVALTRGEKKTQTQEQPKLRKPTVFTA
jgi:hypothetical protein